MQKPKDEIQDNNPGPWPDSEHPDMAAISLVLLVGVFVLWACLYACYHVGHHYLPMLWAWVTQALRGH
jgi:hypothetical protein